MPSTKSNSEIRTLNSENRDYENFEQRTFKFAVRAVKMVLKLPRNNIAVWKIGGQLISSATSVNSNVVQANSGLSKRDFIKHFKISRKEAKESKRWIEMLVAIDLVKKRSVISLLQENEEIIKILVKSIKTAEGNS